MNAQSQNPAAGPVFTLPADFTEAYPGHRHEILTRLQREYDLAIARATPLPGPLRGAFAGEPPACCGLTFQPVNAWLLAILTRLNSPLLDIIQLYRAHAPEFAEASTDDEKAAVDKKLAAAVARIKVPAEAVIETVFAFVTDVEKCQELLDAGTFRKSALAAIGKKFHPAQLAKIEAAIGRHFAGSYATALELESRPDTGQPPGFTPPPPAPPATASAGGSN
jgi:hypothetical protein